MTHLDFFLMEFGVSLDLGFTVDLLYQNLMASLIQRFELTDNQSALYKERLSAHHFSNLSR